MKCEFYSLKEQKKCALSFYGGIPTKENCESCIKNKQNNKEFADTLSFLKRIGIYGAGDVIHKIVNPIAETLDKTLKTNIKNCDGCKKRRKKLNEMFPISVE